MVDAHHHTLLTHGSHILLHIFGQYLPPVLPPNACPVGHTIHLNIVPALQMMKIKGGIPKGCHSLKAEVSVDA